VSLSTGDLFASASVLPGGMHYATDILTFQEEAALLQALPSLPFKEFEFHGFLGKRRVVSLEWHYDFNGAGLRQAGELPGLLLPVRELAARFAGIAPAALEHVLLLDYPPGCRNWLAQGPSRIRRCHRYFVARSLHFPPSSKE